MELWEGFCKTPPWGLEDGAGKTVARFPSWNWSKLSELVPAMACLRETLSSSPSSGDSQHLSELPFPVTGVGSKLLHNHEMSPAGDKLLQKMFLLWNSDGHTASHGTRPLSSAWGGLVWTHFHSLHLLGATLGFLPYFLELSLQMFQEPIILLVHGLVH